MTDFIKNCLRLIIPVAIVSLSVYTVYLVSAQVSGWSEPTVAPPGGNVAAALNTGSIGQSKSGGLILNTSGATNGLIVQSGNVGIGTVNPNAGLDVKNTVRIATTTFTAAISGGIYVATWISPVTTASTYIINLGNGTASGGTLTFLNGLSFPKNASVMYIAAQRTHDEPGSHAGASNPSCIAITAQNSLASNDISIYVDNNPGIYSATCSGLFIGIIKP